MNSAEVVMSRVQRECRSKMTAECPGKDLKLEFFRQDLVRKYLLLATGATGLTAQ